MAEEKQYSYFAFISYSSKDGRWARWLQNRLETYRLPAAVRRDHTDAPKRISPIFRDKTDMTGGYLREQLHKELDDSRFLILICSPNGAASEWVDREARYFIDSGREKQIIPFVVGGKPGSCREYFPPALRERADDSLLGINVTEIGRTGAFLRVVCTMLGLKYDELVRRERKRKLRRGLVVGAFAAAVLAAAAGAWWYNTPHSAWYASYVTRYEIPQGIHKLSQAERASLGEYYHIVTRAGRPVLLERVNSAGHLTDPLLLTLNVERPRTEFIYDDDGRVARAKLYDADGQPVLQKTFAYEPDTRQIAIDYQQPGNSLQAMTLMGDTSEYYTNEDDASRSDIARLLNTYDENGFLTESLYLRDNRNTPACDANGVYGVRYEHNEEGLVVSAAYLDENGKPHTSRYGVAGERYIYDAQGRVVLGVSFDMDGAPVRNEEGYAQMDVAYDSAGNPMDIKLLDENGQLCVCNVGYAELEIGFDERGRRVYDRYFGVDGEPAYDLEEGVHEYRFGYDEQGRVISIDSYDASGEPMYDVYGAAGTRAGYDELDRVVQVRYVDTQGELCATFDGSAGNDMTYDENGYLQSVTFIGQDGEPYLSSSGSVTIYRTYDERGNCLREESLDENGDLLEDTVGVAVYVYEYDSVGNLISESYLDAAEEPCLLNGCGCIRYAYEDGNRVSESRFGLDGEPVSPEGWHESRTEYDDRGNVRCITYHDEQGEPVTDGPARMEMVMDSYGNELERRYYDASGEPYQYDNGSETFWKREYEYDRWGNEVRATYFSLTGEYRRGYATLLWQYDERHNAIRVEYLDEDGQPCADADGSAVLINTYDERNLLLRQEYLDEDGQPGNDYGISAIERQYDERGRLTRDMYYSPDGRGGETPAYQYVYTYDEYGEIISRDRLNPDGTDPGQEKVPVVCVETATGEAAEAGFVPDGVVMLWDGWEYSGYDDHAEAVEAFFALSMSENAWVIAACPDENGEWSIVSYVFDDLPDSLQMAEGAITRDELDDVEQAYSDYVDWLIASLRDGEDVS